MYITDIFIKNFQSHENTHIKLKKGVNCITGTSESGKSAILRAISFVFYNRFPSKFVQFGKESASVKIVFSNGTSITKIKGVTNKIILEYEDGSTKEFVKFGHETPDEVKKFIGSPPMDNNNDPIAYASQFNSYFLINSGPTELPRSISHIVGISNLEESSSVCSKKKKEYERSLKSSTSNIERQEVALSNYKNIENDFLKIKQLEEKLNNIKKIELHIKNIQPIVDKHFNFKNKKDEISPKLEKINQLLNNTNNIKDIKSLLDEISKIKTEVDKHEQLKNKFNSFVLKRLEIDDKKYEFVKKSFNYIISINDIIKSYNILIEKKNELINENKEHLLLCNNTKKDLDDLTNELKKLNKWCDSCNRPLL